MVETLYHYPYDLVVIDGIADLQRNTNDRIVEILNVEYGGVVERATLRNKIVEMLGLNADVAKMRLRRLVNKGILELTYISGKI